MANRIVKVNGKEIEVPEGFDVVIEKNGSIRISKSNYNANKLQGVVIKGTDIPEAASYELKSIDMSFNEEKFKSNVSIVSRVGYIIGCLAGIIFPAGAMIFTLIFLIYKFVEGNNAQKIFWSIIGIPLIMGCIYAIWESLMYITPIKFRRKEPKDTYK